MSDIENQEELEALKTELMGEGEGFGDSTSQQGEPHKKEFIGAETCGTLCGSIFDIVAARKGEKWKLKQEESQALGGALDEVLAKYIPAGLDEYGAETSLILIAIGIIMPRMGGDDNG